MAAGDLALGDGLAMNRTADEAAKISTSDDERTLLQRCEERIGYVFRNKKLLREALTHASSAESRLASNERLEFLGDAILGAFVCEALYHRLTDSLEGELTRIKSVVVSRQTCARLSRALRLEEFLILGKGMTTYQTIPDSLLADVFESLVAAIYLDGGHQRVHEFMQRHLEAEIEQAADGTDDGNYKSLLQQWAQRQFGLTPTYQLLDERGPDHNKCFKVSAQLGQHRYPPAWGRNKKEAEQRAAHNAVRELQGLEPPYPSD